VLADVRLLGLTPRSVIGGTLLVKLPSGAALPFAVKWSGLAAIVEANRIHWAVLLLSAPAVRPSRERAAPLVAARRPLAI